jgi:hypothetical protein
MKEEKQISKKLDLIDEKLEKKNKNCIRDTKLYLLLLQESISNMQTIIKNLS